MSFSLDLGPGGIRFGLKEVDVINGDSGAVVGVIWWLSMVGFELVVVVHGCEAGGFWFVKSCGVLAGWLGFFIIFR